MESQTPAEPAPRARNLQSGCYGNAAHVAKPSRLLCPPLTCHPKDFTVAQAMKLPKGARVMKNLTADKAACSQTLRDENINYGQD